MKLSWKDVLNANHSNFNGTRDSFFKKIVKPSGYRYFLWYNTVYKVIRTVGGYVEYNVTKYTEKDIIR